MTQRIYGLALGYEDLNDHERLRLDPLLATACEKRDPLGQDRFNPAHRGVALAGASTLNRLELSNNKSTRAHKLAHDPAPDRSVSCCKWACAACPNGRRKSWWIWMRWGTGCTGCRKGGIISAYYDDYCYLPLYVFVGDFPLWAQLRTSDKDGADGVVAALEKIIAGHSQTLPPGAHYRARGQRFLPGGDHGLVRGPNGRLLLSGPGQKLRVGGAFGPGAGGRANALVSVRGGQRAGVCGVCVSDRPELEPRRAG